MRSFKVLSVILILAFSTLSKWAPAEGWGFQQLEDNTVSGNFYGATAMSNNDVEVVMEPGTGIPHIVALYGNAVYEKWIDQSNIPHNNVVCTFAGTFMTGTPLGVAAAFSSDGKLGVVVSGGGQTYPAPYKMFVRAYFAERLPNADWSSSGPWKLIYSKEDSTLPWTMMNYPRCFVKLAYDWRYLSTANNGVLGSNRIVAAIGAWYKCLDPSSNWVHTNQVAVVDVSRTNLPNSDYHIEPYNYVGSDAIQLEALCLTNTRWPWPASTQTVIFSLYNQYNPNVCGIYRGQTVWNATTNVMSIPSGGTPQILPSTKSTVATRKMFLSTCWSWSNEIPTCQYMAYSDLVDDSTHQFKSCFVDGSSQYSTIPISHPSYPRTTIVGSIFGDTTGQPVVTLLHIDKFHYLDWGYHSSISISCRANWPLREDSYLTWVLPQGDHDNDIAGWAPLIASNPFVSANVPCYSILTQALKYNAQAMLFRKLVGFAIPAP